MRSIPTWKRSVTTHKVVCLHRLALRLDEVPQARPGHEHTACRGAVGAGGESGICVRGQPEVQGQDSAAALPCEWAAETVDASGEGGQHARPERGLFVQPVANSTANQRAAKDVKQAQGGATGPAHTTPFIYH